jgi:hypothetical protein
LNSESRMFFDQVRITLIPHSSFLIAHCSLLIAHCSFLILCKIVKNTLYPYDILRILCPLMRKNYPGAE